MALLLECLGARVTGVALGPTDAPNMFDLLSPWPHLHSNLCDIRDAAALEKVVQAAQPEIVVHMAANALVHDAYKDPVGTVGTNVLGTVHLLEHLRGIDCLSVVLVITSDKVYENREAGIDFPETAALGGQDPYSASKAAAEILTAAYRRSYFAEKDVSVVTARAGNVIGGGDWARNRLIPDLWRAYESQNPVFMRAPDSVRPWQHVLDPLYGYLLYIQGCLTARGQVPTALNFGPPREPVSTVLQVAKQFAAALESKELWSIDPTRDRLHESQFLSIDSRLARDTLGWTTSLRVNEAVRWTCDWYKAFHDGEDMRSFCLSQIESFADSTEEVPLIEGARSANP